jgi:hypothetical protein
MITSCADDKLEELMKSYNTIADEHENPLIIVEGPNSSQPSWAKRFNESTAEKQSSKKSKRYAEVPQDIYSSKHHSGTQHHLLPVLGLCAPNTDQMNSHKNSSCGSSMKEPKRTSGEANKLLSTPTADHSSEQRDETESDLDKATFRGASEEALRRLNIIPNSYFPFNPVCSILCFGIPTSFGTQRIIYIVIHSLYIVRIFLLN